METLRSLRLWSYLTVSPEMAIERVVLGMDLGDLSVGDLVLVNNVWGARFTARPIG